MQINNAGQDVISRLIALDASVAAKSRIGVAIASKQIQAQKQQGQAIVNLIQQSSVAGGTTYKPRFPHRGFTEPARNRHLWPSCPTSPRGCYTPGCFCFFCMKS